MKGIISALVVPFTDSYQVDYEKLRAVIDYNIDKSEVDGLYINGSSGETFTVDTQTKKEIFKVVAEHVDGRVDLIAQIGSINIQESLELGLYVKEIGGYSAISAVTPFYYKFSFEDVKRYYKTIVSAVDMDMIIYSIPLFTGVTMSLKQFDELFSIDRVIGVKFTDNDFYTLERLRAKYPNVLMYSGFDEMLINSAVLGIDGAIGSTYNFQGKIAKELFQCVADQRIKEALALQKIMNDTITILLEAGLYQTIKAVLTEDGCDAGICNAPLAPTTQDQYQAAKKILDILK